MHFNDVDFLERATITTNKHSREKCKFVVVVHTVSIITVSEGGAISNRCLNRYKEEMLVLNIEEYYINSFAKKISKDCISRGNYCRICIQENKLNVLIKGKLHCLVTE